MGVGFRIRELSFVECQGSGLKKRPGFRVQDSQSMPGL